MAQKTMFPPAGFGVFIKRRIKLCLLSVLFLIFLTIPVSAQTEDPIEDMDDPFFSMDFFDLPDDEEPETELETKDPSAASDFDSLFLDSDMIDVLDEKAQNPAAAEDLLKTERVTWGGSFQGSLDVSIGWEDFESDDFDFFDPPTRSLNPTVSTSLFFSARPDTDFRVFGKLKIETSSDFLSGLGSLSSLTENLNFTINEDGSISIGSSDSSENGDEQETEEYEPGTGSTPLLTLSIFELFSDFSYKDSLYFRFGKHTIKWGVGYFFSPADVLNLTSIDAEDPTADRQGPVSLKTHVPFGVNNAYLYIITNSGIRPSEVAIAPKVEFVKGKAEISLAGYYQRALAPRLISTLTLASGDFTYFGEGVLSYGSDRIFVRKSKDQSAAEEDGEGGLEVVLDTYKIDNLPIASATAGFIYLNTKSNITIMAQYFFNGDGYADSGLLVPAYRLLNNPNENGLAVSDTESRPEGYTEPPALAQGDLANFGRHYGAVMLSKSEIFETDLSVSAFSLVNFSDLSGIFTFTLSYKLFNRMSLSGSLRLTFGEEGDEYTNPVKLATQGKVTPTLGLTFTLSAGSGSF